MLQVFSNYYSTNGFSIRPNSIERTVAPIERLTNQIQINYPFSNKTKLSVLARYNYENIINKIAVTNTGSTTYSDGIEKHNDYNINPILTHQFSKKVNSSLRLYHSRFKSTQDLSTNTPNSYNDYFLQDFYRAENQTDINLSDKNSMNIGAGYIAENVRSSRYDSKDNVKHNNIAYGFIQT